MSGCVRVMLTMRYRVGVALMRYPEHRIATAFFRIVNMFAVLSDTESFDKMDIVQTTEPMESVPPSSSEGTNQHAARM